MKVGTCNWWVSDSCPKYLKGKIAVWLLTGELRQWDWPHTQSCRYKECVSHGSLWNQVNSCPQNLLEVSGGLCTEQPKLSLIPRDHSSEMHSLTQGCRWREISKEPSRKITPVSTYSILGQHQSSTNFCTLYLSSLPPSVEMSDIIVSNLREEGQRNKETANHAPSSTTGFSPPINFSRGRREDLTINQLWYFVLLILF